MKANLVTETTNYILCPKCDIGKSDISHLSDGTKTRWHCHECGIQYDLQVNSQTDVDTEIVNKPADKNLLTLLVLEPHDKPVYFVINDKAYEGEIDGKEYLYNEHTCPTNYVSQIQTIIDGDDYDPHGIFQYVGSSFVEDDFDFDDDDKVRSIVDNLKATEQKDGAE